MARRHYKQKSMKKRSVTELTSRCDGTAEQRGLSSLAVNGSFASDISTEQS
jgi:hypothetical protein